jgi:hypothetical protein
MLLAVARLMRVVVVRRHPHPKQPFGSFGDRGLDRSCL